MESGGPDGELGASMRYLSQRYTMPYPELRGLLTDIGISVSEMFQSDKSADTVGFFLYSIDAQEKLARYQTGANFDSTEFSTVPAKGQKRRINVHVSLAEIA